MKATIQKTKDFDGIKRSWVDTQDVVGHPRQAKRQISSPLSVFSG
jgi:hypothetical protein